MKTKHAQSSSTGAGRDPVTVRGLGGAAVPAKWQWHYRTLHALRQRLLQQREEQRLQAAEPIEPPSSHAADSGTDEFDHDLALTWLAREENALRDVNDAITRILEHRYGVCEASGATIPAARLRALPWCRYTLEAEREREGPSSTTGPRLPGLVSLRGRSRNIPETGTISHENSEGPTEQPRERREVAAEEVPTEEGEAEEAGR